MGWGLKVAQTSALRSLLLPGAYGVTYTSSSAIMLVIFLQLTFRFVGRELESFALLRIC